MSTFSRILIANRSEIASRVIRTAQDLGYSTVAVFSDPDSDSSIIRQADLAVSLGGVSSAESYLDIGKILSAAKRSGADAIHPGYGFLSENPEFAEACAQAGLVFIGPPPEAIRAMANKREAKEKMRTAGVPVVPGSQGSSGDDAALIAAAKEIGTPIMIKAAAGGGGRGMRLVHDFEKLPSELSIARAESLNAFGSDELIIEKAVLNARHVEIQVFADTHGNCIHLGERDCSLQRRHQKVIEESPSPAVDEALRQRMGEAAVLAAKSVGYVGAGTVEFLLGEDGEFYFLEMNTRLQVEHPVTEMVTGLDLVRWQLDVASGKPLPLTQEQVKLNGHAVEARLYAEDPWEGFLPQTGTVENWWYRETPHTRFDHALFSGQEITPHYDAMVAKIIAWGDDRQTALRRLSRALEGTELFGVRTNLAFLHLLVNHPDFAEGHVSTRWIDDHAEKLLATRPEIPSYVLAMAARFLVVSGNSGCGPTFGDTFETLLAFRVRDTRYQASISQRNGRSTVTIGETTHEIRVLDYDPPGEVRIEYDGIPAKITLDREEDHITLQYGPHVEVFERVSLSDKAAAKGDTGDAIIAPMTGKLLEVLVKEGDTVNRNQTVAVIEAMKMQMQLKAPRDGTVEAIRATPGNQVNAKAVIITLAKEEEA